MKKIIIIILLSLTLVNFTQAAEISDRLSGKILLEVEDKGQAWYVDPLSRQRAYLGRPAEAFRIMRELGLGISEASYNLFNGKADKKLAGRILLRVEAHGEAYWVNPENLTMLYLGRPTDAFQIMRTQGLGIKTSELSKIAIYEKYQETLPVATPVQAYLSDKINVYVFHSETCPHCTKAISFLENLASEQKDINIIKLESWKNEGNASLYKKVKEAYGYDVNGVPFIMIGDSYVYGYGGDNSSGEQIINYINEERVGEKHDLVFPLMDDVYRVVKVVDGDTLDVLIAGETKRVRIIGVDTPEVVDPRQGVDCFGPEASGEAKRLLENTYVRLETDATQDEVDKYGRLLRHVFLPNGDNFAEEMIASGYAREYTYFTASKYQTDYALAELSAKQAKLGLWQDGVCDNFVASADRVEKNSYASQLEIANIFYNGDEGSLEPDEYVEIKNNGASQSLGAYTLRDAGGKVYNFLNFTLDKDASVKVFTGCGQNTVAELYWCFTNSAIWNNTGDEAELRNSAGETVANYKY